MIGGTKLATRRIGREGRGGVTVGTPVRYSVVVPVYNEESVLRETYRRLSGVMDALGESYELLFINDGSEDHSEAIINDLAQSDPKVKLISFSRNFGHQIAITAGMDHARGEAVIIIDADLQDPPELIAKLIDKWQEGYQVVYAKRSQRVGESSFKRWTAALFYRLLRSLTDVNIPLDTGDFRLIDRQVCDAMSQMREKGRFVRGLVSWVGFRQTAVEYVRAERWAGETKYPLKKMMRLAIDAIASFSFTPIKAATYLGLFFAVLGLLGVGAVLLLPLFNSRAGYSWVPVVGLVLFLNGITLMFLGAIGEYIGRIYEEAKNRPLYIVSNYQGFRDVHVTRKQISRL